MPFVVEYAYDNYEAPSVMKVFRTFEAADEWVKKQPKSDLWKHEYYDITEFKWGEDEIDEENQ